MYGPSAPNHTCWARPTRTVAGTLFLMALYSSGGCATVKQAASGAAERATGREVAERVDRGVSAAADGAEEAVRGNGGSNEEGGATRSVPSATDPTDETSGPPSVSTTYDFQPGDRILFADDFGGDNLGDFPRALKWQRGNIEVVQIDDERFLAASSSNAAFSIPLTEALPERFTIEMDVWNSGAPYGLLMTTGTLPDGRNNFSGEPHLQWAAAAFQGHGLLGSDGTRLAVTNAEVDAVRGTERAPVTARVMVDDEHLKLYWGHERIANVPQVDLPRGDAIHFVLEASPEAPIYIGKIRIAAGGRDLYAVLERDGRFTAEGIEFDTGSDEIRPSSRTVLDEIGAMLRQHQDLEVLIEGHTDAEGSEATNQDLSERRAASVRRYLTENYGVKPDRLESAGFGESRPVASNDTAAGRQQNRRVEIVRASPTGGAP